MEQQFAEAILRADVLSVTRLLKANVDPNCQVGPKGETALHHLCIRQAEGGRSEIAHALLQARARLDVFDTFGRTPLQCAARASQEPLVRALLSSASVSSSVVNLCDKYGVTPLLAAVAPSPPPAASSLISSHGTRTTAAAAAAATATVRALLSSRAAPHARDDEGHTALMLCAWHGDNAGTVEELLSARVDVNACDESGQTALMFAARTNHLSVAARLIAAKAWLNATTDMGASALDWAIRCAQPAMVCTLLRARASVTISNINNMNNNNRRGLSPLMRAAARFCKGSGGAAEEGSTDRSRATGSAHPSSSSSSSCGSDGGDSPSVITKSECGPAGAAAAAAVALDPHTRTMIRLLLSASGTVEPDSLRFAIVREMWRELCAELVAELMRPVVVAAVDDVAAGSAKEEEGEGGPKGGAGSTTTTKETQGSKDDEVATKKKDPTRTEGRAAATSSSSYSSSMRQKVRSSNCSHVRRRGALAEANSSGSAFPNAVVSSQGAEEDEEESARAKRLRFRERASPTPPASSLC